VASDSTVSTSPNVSHRENGSMGLVCARIMEGCRAWRRGLGDAGDKDAGTAGLFHGITLWSRSLRLDDLTRPLCCLSCPLGEFACASCLLDQSDDGLAVEVAREGAVGESFTDVTREVSTVGIKGRNGRTRSSPCKLSGDPHCGCHLVTRSPGS
jgi:hypothetical protein